MADIITNLHPDGDENTNLYPNIKKENIPSKSISTDKLDDNVLSLIGSLKPSGTDTSTNILAFTSNKGIYVATDNGHWYYWNGSAYADGGVYQATEIADKSVDIFKLDNELLSLLPFKDTYTYTTPTVAITNKYVEKTGAVYNLTDWYISSAIQVKKNDVIKFKLKANNQVACLSWCNTELTSFTPILIGDTDVSVDNVKIYQFQSDGYVALCWYKTEAKYILAHNDNYNLLTDIPSLNELKDNFIEDVSTNRFNKDDAFNESGVFWTPEGTKASAEGYYISHKIPIKPNDVIRVNNTKGGFGGNRGAYLDENSNWLSQLSNDTLIDDSYYEIIVPSTSTAKYIQINYYISNISSLMVTINKPFPSEYTAWKQDRKLLSNDIFLNDNQLNQIQNSKLYGKFIAYNGDSICESRLNTESFAYNGGAYAKMIADVTGGTYENRAIGGGVLVSASSGISTSRYVVDDVQNMSANADLVCFEGGINDYWNGAELGSYSESDYSSTLDVSTICGALESIFRQAMVRWLGKPIVFVITHKIPNTVYVQNSKGYTWMDVHDKIVGICKKYSIPYFDAFNESGLNGYVSAQANAYLNANSQGTTDWCHPNADGYKKYYVPQLIKLFESLIER